MAEIIFGDLSLTQNEFNIAVSDLILIRYAIAATLTLLTFDYLLTFDDERRLVWGSRLFIPKIVFFINRYLPFAAVIGLSHVIIVKPSLDENCRLLFLAFGGLIYVTYCTAEFILYMRVYAIWECKRWMLVIVLSALLAAYTCATYFAGRFMHSAGAVPIKIFPNGCVVYYTDQVNWASFIVLICSETFALGLLLLRATQVPQSAVLKTMFQDGIVYYICILASSLANLIILRSTRVSLCNFLLGFQAALHSIFCNRLLLRIRGAYETLGATFSVHAMSDVDIDLDVGAYDGGRAQALDSDYPMTSIRYPDTDGWERDMR